MTFQQPFWIWMLVLPPLFVVWRFISISRARERFGSFAVEKVWNQIAPELDWGARKRRAVFLGLSLIFLFLSLARPQWGLKEEVIRVTGLDVIVALDVSNSMEVEDVIPNRMKKAHHFIRSLINRLGSDRVGVVAFAASTYLACPLTTDHGYVAEILEGLGPKSILNQGTDIGLALETSVQALERGAEQEGDRDGTRVIVLVTDGEDLEEGALEGAKKVEQSGARLYVLGVGSEKGGPIPIRDETGTLNSYRKDLNGQSVVSHMSPSALEKIAQAAKGRFIQVSQNEAELDELIKDIGGLNRTDKFEKRRITLQERFQIPLVLALIFLLIEMAIPIRKKIFKNATQVAASIAAVLFSCVPIELASAKDSIEVYMENKKGVESFQKGNMEDAQEHFGRAQAADPHKPELLFNQGVIQLGQKSLDQAVDGFSGAAKEAMERKNPGLAGRAQYNLGGTLAAKGDTDSAIQSYLDGIDSAKAAQDPELEKDLRKKIEMLAQNQQQKQKNKNNQDDKNKSKSDQENKNEPNKDKGDSESGGKPQQQDQGSQAKDEKESQGKKPFQSQKLNKEDAERVMNELAEHEKELQAKMIRQKGRPEKRDKDW